MIEAILAASLIALSSLVGVFFFGNNRQLEGVARYVIPAAVGVFLSLALFELIPETLELSPRWGGVAVAAGFILFYILSYELHRYFHNRHRDDKNCHYKGGATLLLIGDAIHNIADGVVLGGAFLIDPAVGSAVAVGLALHEIPQEIVEFGILVRAGYSRVEAAFLNLISASSIILGTVVTLILAETAEDLIWVVTGLAAGNLLYIATGDLLPRVHGSLKGYGSFWTTLSAMIVGFVFMTSVLVYTHETFGHGHSEVEHEDEHGHSEDDHEDHHLH